MHIELTKALETSKHVAKESTDDKTGRRSASTAFKRIHDLLNSPEGGGA